MLNKAQHTRHPAVLFGPSQHTLTPRPPLPAKADLVTDPGEMAQLTELVQVLVRNFKFAASTHCSTDFGTHHSSKAPTALPHGCSKAPPAAAAG